MDSTEEKGRKEINIYLDRIEELEDGSGEAILYVEDDEDEFREFVLPADFLPEDAAEGDYLTLTISRDKEKTQEALEEARNLLKNLEE